MHEYTMAGFPGCIGSADATHITLEKCWAKLGNMHKGGKSAHTTRAFNITVNHRRRILYSTKGYPGRWNDKTLVQYDRLLRGIRDGSLLEDLDFKLYEEANGDIQVHLYRGPWVMVDNGYLSWSTTIPPMKEPFTFGDLRWSKWLESMRKDVECTFGILKGRYIALQFSPPLRPRAHRCA